MPRSISRRALLRTATWTALGSGAAPLAYAGPRARPPSVAVALASANGIDAVRKAYNLATRRKHRPVTAAVQGVALVEADPDDLSVGYGGLPNEAGVVQLDACCMDGPTHNAGSVAAIEDIMHPAQVAELVMDQTDHVNLVGAGAKQFALDHGFRAVSLLTARSRAIWLKWRSSRSGDDRLWPLGDHDPVSPALGGEARPWGTIHCSVVGPTGDVGCCTTTSGLAFKIPGRIGDSPLVGSGLYCDNVVGSAGATGRGEAAILSGGSWFVVERMRQGDTPEQACIAALRRVAAHSQRSASWQPALWNGDRPGFGLTFYAVRTDGAYGSATMVGRPGQKQFAVCDAQGPRHEACAVVYPTT